MSCQTLSLTKLKCRKSIPFVFSLIDTSIFQVPCWLYWSVQLTTSAFDNYTINVVSANKIKQINRTVRGVWTYRRTWTLVILPSAKFRHIGGYVAYRFRCKNIRPSVGFRIFHGVAVCNKSQGVMPRFLPGDIFSRASGAFITTVDWPRRLGDLCPLHSRAKCRFIFKTTNKPLLVLFWESTL